MHFIYLHGLCACIRDRSIGVSACQWSPKLLLFSIHKIWLISVHSYYAYCNCVNYIATQPSIANHSITCQRWSYSFRGGTEISKVIQLVRSIIALSTLHMYYVTRTATSMHANVPYRVGSTTN